MDLLKLDLAGFRRFESASIDFLGRLVAIVGPNEAGKSSLLEALTRLNSDEPLRDSDLTRGSIPADDDIVLTARFSLDDDDRATIRHISEAKDAKRFVLTKRRSGNRRGWIEPRVKRDPAVRQAAKKLLQKVKESNWARDNAPMVSELWPGAEAAVVSETSTLTEDEISQLSSLVDRLESEADRSTPARLRSAVQTLVASERTPDPHNAAVTMLMSRVPEFLLFGDNDRSLASAYDLATVADAPPSALANFANLAGLDIRAARDAAARADYGELETTQRAANEVLARVFSTGWRQSVLSVQLRFDRAELRPIVQNLSGSFTELGERSDGLRIFVALVSYLAREERTVKPVLLIDEAETHLHYDAQADLVRVLNSQDAAAKVLYTTHSAGCLPFDLGTGIRVVRMKVGDRSEIDNAFWTSGTGFTPLVMAMGAAALAFTPSRRAVIGEGITDSILLPTMLREAVGDSEVDYQIVPGLANADTDVINALDLEAARVAFLVDSDKSGRDRRKFFVGLGVPSDRIILLGQPTRKDLVLEDLLRADAYRAAVNAELSVWQVNAALPASAVPSRGRIAALSAWCAKNGVNVPDKKRVATQVLSLRGDSPLTSASGRAILQTLHQQVREILDRPRLGLEPALGSTAQLLHNFSYRKYLA